MLSLVASEQYTPRELTDILRPDSPKLRESQHGTKYVLPGGVSFLIPCCPEEL